MHGVSVIDYREIEVHKAKSDPVWLTIKEVAGFLGAVDSLRDKALFSCLFSSGARISELLQLNRDSIVDGAASIIGKGDKRGTIYFDPAALMILDEYLRTRSDHMRPLFISGQYRRITVSRVEQLTHMYADYASIDKNVTPHVFRHSRATDFKLNGADIYDVQKLLRHASISTTQIYTHIGDEVQKANHQKYGTPTPI